MTKMSDLPGELVEEILCRVPAISLKRLRTSCKRWNHLFNNKEFARNHNHKAPKQSFVLTVTKEYKICLMSLSLHGTPSLEFKGEHSLLDYSNQVRKFFHCDGLLLCTFYKDTRILLWNPCAGRTRWIQTISASHSFYALGSYQESSYKILSCRNSYVREYAIYEVNSNSWRILDVIPDFNFLYIETYVSLKGKTYWFASDSTKGKQLDMFLVSFDYTTERFGRLSLPSNSPLNCFRNASLSVVSQDKLAVLLLRKNTWGKEIWVSNKIYGTNEVSWRKILTVNYAKRDFWIPVTRFFLNEEKKVALCCETCVLDLNATMKKFVYVAGEDNIVKLMDNIENRFGPIILDYVPSLVQIPGSVAKDK